MKLQKLLKKLALPVFALVVVGMLAACSSPSGGGSGSGSGSGGQNNTPGSTTPLVDESEVTVSASKIELSDGNWSYKEISTYSDGDHDIREANLTVSENGTVIVYTAIKSTHTETIPEGASDKDIADAQAMGYIINGNTFSVVENYSAEALEKENKNAKYAFSSSSFKNIKTNSDKTKYSWTEERTIYDSREDAEKGINGISFTTKSYIVKTSSASSSDAHKDEGEGHKPQGGESGGSGQQGGATTVDTVYTFEEYDEKKDMSFIYTITAKPNGTYVATVKMQMGGVSIDMPVEEGTYVLKGDKVTTTSTKEINKETGELEDVSEPLTKTFKIGANNVLTPDMSGSSGSGTENGGTANQGSSTGKYKIYYEVKGHDPDLVMELPASLLEAFAKDVGLTDSEYEIDNTKKMILVNEDGQEKVTSKTALVQSKYSEYFVTKENHNGGASGSGDTSGQPSQGGKTTIPGDDDEEYEDIMKYQGALVGGGQTVYVIITMTGEGSGNWSSQGYTDANYTTPTTVGTIKNGTWENVNETTIKLYASMFGDTPITGTSTNYGHTVTCSGPYAGTLTSMMDFN